MKLVEIPRNHSTSKLSIGIVVSEFNKTISDGLLKGAMRFLESNDSGSLKVTVLRVDGALEIPIALRRMAQSDHFDVLVALGAVIRGETYHFEIVSNESAAGLARVTHDFDIVIGNGILTCENDEQAIARMDQKGFEAVAAAVAAHNATVQLDKQ
ncbi:MAG: 6,7-dimethyl-8-ribityllumazine synthase [Burkholderiales bacterium]|jgi:6,7-dimethyl-8-ribityllumazine synthase|nr:6,7-dimethyl-8-ribityllumazine synthase [Burkholderiales bacterium]